MNKVDVSELRGPLAELLAQVGNPKNGRARLEEFNLWLKGVVLPPHGVLIKLTEPCRLPFEGAERIGPKKSGFVKIELRGDDLYLGGLKLGLFRSESQMAGSVISGHELRKELEATGEQTSAKVLDTLVEHPELWPENWKRDAEGNIIYVFFWDDIFRHPVRDRLCVRYGYLSDVEVVSSYRWLDDYWSVCEHSASRAS